MATIGMGHAPGAKIGARRKNKPSRVGGKTAPKTKRVRRNKPASGAGLNLKGIRSGFVAALLWLFGLAFLVVVLGGVSFSLVYGYRGLTTSAFFQVQEVRVQGLERLEREEILAAADLAVGRNSLDLNIREVESALRAHPWVEQAAVKRVLPGAVEVTVTERRAAFIAAVDEGLFYVDEAGRLIDGVEANRFLSLPQLVVEPGGEDNLPHLAEWMRALERAELPLPASGADWVRLSAHDMELFFEERGLALRIRTDAFFAHLRRLELAYADLFRRGEHDQVSMMTAVEDRVWVKRSAKDERKGKWPRQD